MVMALNGSLSIAILNQIYLKDYVNCDSKEVRLSFLKNTH